MRAFMFRGGGKGIMHEKVFTKWPSQNDVNDALKAELELHGLNIQMTLDKNKVPIVTGATPNECWVRIVETEIADLEGPDPVVPADAAYEYRGMLHDDDVQRLIEAAKPGPPGVHRAVEATPYFYGEGKIINPGEPGWVPPEQMSVTSADVGTVPAAVLVPSAPVTKPESVDESDVHSDDEPTQ